MKNKKVLGIIAAVLAVAVATSVFMILTRESADYTLLSSDDAEKPVYKEGILSGVGMLTLGSVGDRRLDYSAEDKIFYVKDNKSGVVFSSGASEDYYKDNGSLQTADRFLLCQVSYTDFSGNNDIFTSSDPSCTVNARPLQNGAALELYFASFEIGFTVEVWLNEHGLMARIPQSSITEKGIYGITAITLFPNLGAAKNDAGAYAVFPDGSGSLCRFAEGDVPKSPVSSSVYFESTFDLDTVKNDSTFGNLNAAIPAYGICRGNEAITAYALEGDENGFVTLSPATEGYGLNRLYMSCRYRKQYSYTTPTGLEISTVERSRTAGDFSVQYLFLADNGGVTYGDMATALRELMLAKGILVPTDLKNKVSVQLIMGTRQNTSLSSNYQALTSFKQAQELAEKLSGDKKDALRLFLLGWQKNGYGLNPAGDSASNKLGGKKGLKELNLFAEKQGIDLYLVNDYVYAQKGGIGFNKNSQAVYNEANQPVTNSKTESFLLNQLLELEKFTKKRLNGFKKLKTGGVAFDKMGNFLYDDYQKGRKLTRKQCAEAFSGMLAAAKNEKLSTAVQGGNAYALKASDYIYDLPERNSENSGFAQAIPFYQMIIHGVIGYCGSVPGNMASDYQTEKLKWIEYGSEPYFVLTYESSDLLKDTYITEAFATDWKAQLERVQGCIDEFGGALAFTADQTVADHTIIDRDLVCVTYSGGNKILINYGNNERNYQGATVRANDYTVIKGGKAE